MHRYFLCYVKCWDTRKREWFVAGLPPWVWLWGRFTNEIAPGSVCDTPQEIHYNVITIPRSKIVFD